MCLSPLRCRVAPPTPPPPSPSLHPQVHSERTKVTMVAQRKLKEPKQVVYAAAKINKGVIGKAMKADAAAIIAALESVCV